jgi:hypothetical protein
MVLFQAAMEAGCRIVLGMSGVLAQKPFTFLLQSIFVRYRWGRRLREGGAHQGGGINYRQNSLLRVAHRAYREIGSVVGPALGARQTIASAPGAELKPRGKIFWR